MTIVFYDSRNKVEKWAHVAIGVAAEHGDVYVVGPSELRETMSQDLQQKISFVGFNELPLYQRNNAEFANLYQHMSTAPFAYEFACFDRFLALDALMDARGMKQVWHLDTDVAVARALPIDLGKDQRALALTGINNSHSEFSGVSAGNSLVDQEAVKSFVNYVLGDMYSDSSIADLRDWFSGRLRQGLTGGVCDMTAWGMVAQQGGLRGALDLGTELVGESLMINTSYAVHEQLRHFVAENIDHTSAVILKPSDATLNVSAQSTPLLGVHFSGADKWLINDWAKGRPILVNGRRHMGLRSAYRVRRKSLSTARTTAQKVRGSRAFRALAGREMETPQ